MCGVGGSSVNGTGKHLTESCKSLFIDAEGARSFTEEPYKPVQMRIAYVHFKV